MKPVLYLANGCHQCAMVKKFAENAGVEIDIFNVDTQNIKPPTDIFIYPALFIKEQLVAYGEDIITYFKDELMR